MKHFLNREMLAPNALTARVDPAIVAEFAGLDYATLAGFTTIQPQWNSDIQWVSAATEERFALFQSAFERLGVADHVREYLDLESNVRLYAGFLVIRSACEEPHFHVDWTKTNNEAFTMMTPVSDNAAGFGLLYDRLDGKPGEYEYKKGEAIVFGDLFRHSTKPGRSEEPVVLLCFEFGTDKIEHWDKIFATIGSQARLLLRPDGVFVPGVHAKDRAY